LNIFYDFISSISGRNSAVECQLPKLDVVGSSPIARSSFIKIAFFFFANLILSLSLNSKLFAQSTTDSFWPFDQGQVIELPGATRYLGDLPQEIDWVSNPAPFHTVEGVLSQQTGWVGQGFSGPLGINNGSPGVLFEGIPYPFHSAVILNWLPVNRNMELLNFPSSAWWGPNATTGAVQLRLPDIPDETQKSLNLWSGSETAGGLQGYYQNHFFSFDGATQHGFLNGYGSSDTFETLSGLKWKIDNPFELESGFLGSQWFGSDNWYSIFTSLKWHSQDFQTVEWKPFIQVARLNNLETQEFGSNINYSLNMGDILESQLGLGFSHDDFSTSSNIPGLNKTFIQNTETLDALGLFMMNIAFRWDFSTANNSVFSLIGGAEYPLGDFLLLGSYAKGQDPVLNSQTQFGELGFRYLPDESFFASGKYVYQVLNFDIWNGGKIKLEWDPTETVFGLMRGFRIEAQEQVLINSIGEYLFDTTFKFRWRFFRPLAFWIGGREISDQGTYGEGGMDCAISKDAKIYASLENIGNSPISWPEPIDPQGRFFWLGIEDGF
jgi:hypothetical protein